MMKKIRTYQFVFIIVFTFFSGKTVFAEERLPGYNALDVPPFGTNNSNNLNGIEIGPFFYVKQFEANITRSVWSYGDIYAGFRFCKFIYDDDGESDIKIITAGYRQFFLWGFFISSGFNGTRYNYTESSTNNEYEGWQLSIEPGLGARWDFVILGEEFYLVPIFIVPIDLYTTNKWPDYKNGQYIGILLMCGYRF